MTVTGEGGVKYQISNQQLTCILVSDLSTLVVNIIGAISPPSTKQQQQQNPKQNKQTKKQIPNTCDEEVTLSIAGSRTIRRLLVI